MKPTARKTALAEYNRLEATALWREAPDAQRQEVVISLGEATLVIATLSDRAVSHWSLPAIERRNPGRRPAVYAPGPDTDESLEINDANMIAAIERLRGAIEQGRPHPGRLRYGIVALVGVALLLLAVFWLPDALIRQTAAILPTAKRAEIGAGILEEMTMLAGRPCATPEGSAALARLASRSLGAGGARVVVLPQIVAGTTHLPGGIVIVDRGLVENHETPEVLAGFILLENTRRLAADPMLALLSRAGLATTFRLLTSGQMRAADMRDHATHLLTERPPALDNATMLAAFTEAEISSAPYAYAIDISGETTLPLIEGDPLRGQDRAPLLRDQAWIALQEICGT